VGAAGGAARGSLVTSRWVGSGYGRWPWHGRWVGESVELSVTVPVSVYHASLLITNLAWEW